MKDLTKGYPFKVILLFALPLMFGNIFQQLYNMADSKIVSMYVGTAAFAAVGATSVVSNAMISFVSGLTQGFAILIANSFGAKDYRKMRQFVAGTMSLTLLVALLLSVCGQIGIVPILKLLNTPEDILPEAVSYVRIILLGILFVALYNMCANMLRAVGDSKRPLFCLMIAIVLNILLDLLFVGALNMKIQGAAYATLISQAVSSISCAGVLLFRFRELLPKREEFHLDKGQYQSLITTGLSMGLMGCIVNIGSVVLQGAINSLGTKIVAAHTASRRMFDIMVTMLGAIAFTMTTFVSQNMGAKRFDRVRQGIRHAIIIESVFSTVLIVLCFAFGKPVLCWLTSTTDSEIISASVMYIRVSIVFFYILGPLLVLRCSLQGMGKKVIPVFTSVLEMALKMLSAVVLVPAFQYFGVALTEPVSWAVMTTVLVAAYCYYIKTDGVRDVKESNQGEN